jgi:parallel beta-helix repeat protein
MVLPNGVDDTSDIQAAFNSCVGYGPGCTIQLVLGTYHTSQIAVTGFQGSFVGAGPGSTIVLGNPNLASPTADPFWSALPGPANPWPAMFTFVNGAFSIFGMTFSDTNFYPTLGWDYPGIGTVTALWSWVLITGTAAYVSMSHVAGVGGPGDQGPWPGSSNSFNNIDGMTFAGMLLPPGYSDVHADQIPITGTFSVTSSTFRWSETGVWAENTLDATVTACFNSMQTIVSNGFWDISASQMMFCGNVDTNIASIAGGGYGGAQSVYKTDLLPSTAAVVGNYFSVNTGGAGVVFFDFGPSVGVASTLSTVITGNVVVADTTCAACWSGGYPLGMLAWALVNFDALYNVVTASPNAAGFGIGVNNYYGGVGTGGGEIIGNVVAGSDNGTALFGASGFSVTGNTVKNSGSFGIMLWYGSSNNVVSWNVVKNSGLDDLSWDGSGAGNVWSHNYCQTSSPTGLC